MAGPHIDLIEGVKSNDLTRVQNALQSDFSPYLKTGEVLDVLTDYGFASLYKYAYENGVFSLVYHEAAMLLAASLGHETTLNPLLTYNIVLFEKYDDKLLLSSIIGYPNTFKLLYSNGKIDAQYMPQVMESVVNSNDISLVTYLLQNGFDLSTCCTDETYVYSAILNTSNLNMVVTLLDNGARVHPLTANSELILAAGKDEYNSIVEELLSRNLFPDQTEKNNALVKASNSDAVANVKTLLNYGADPKSLTPERLTQIFSS